MDVLWDMETGDPDDFLTLLLLLGHPRVRLVGVTITPGTPDQVGVVRAALSWFGRSIPVGAFNLDHRTKGPPGQGRHGPRGMCVSSWHYRAYGPMPPSRDAVSGPELLAELANEATTLITGGPLRNLGAALKIPGFRLGRLVVQGGFAGEGVVPTERQLPKFRGMTTCATYNLNGDPAAALAVLASPSIASKRFVSKNVCHGVVYDEAMHATLAALRGRSRALDLIWRGMDASLRASASPRRPELPRNAAIAGAEVRLVVGEASPERMSTAEALRRAAALGLDLVAMTDEEVPIARVMPPRPPPRPRERPGKKLHDPLAACCAIDPGVAEWAEVELYRESGRWGARLSPGSGVEIIVGYDPRRFLEVFTEVDAPAAGGASATERGGE
ncbi:MAG: nucleoside hydrolase [Nannocystaceae bacterium]